VTDDPKRWLSEDGGEAPERELLASLHDARPPSDAKERAWRGIATSIAAGAAAASIAPSAAAATVTKASTIVASTLATKVLWTVAAGSIAASSYFAAQRAWPKPPAPQQRAPVVQTVPAVEAPEIDDEPHVIAPEATEAPREPEAQPQAVRAAPRAKRKNPLAAESELITRARAALQAGDAAAAERFLQQMRAESPQSVLGQEREVLSIEVLEAKGDLAAAKQRARRFAAAHPNSVHSARLRSLLDTP
jgi:hypothetical protein